MDDATAKRVSAIAGVKVEPLLDDLTTFTPEQRAAYIANEKESLRGNPLAPDPAPKPKNVVFPRNPDRFLWTKDNFGPLWVPEKGQSVVINDSTMTLYRKCIETYEHNEVSNNGGQWSINGSPATSYTFKMNYYWMMGDNRHQSLDSRFWGFVPEDHIVGRPWFVLFSYEGGPRWDRFFKPASTWEP
jgi:signal peptidase I